MRKVKDAATETLPVEVQPGGQLKMAYQEFLKWANEAVHAEWVNGEVIILMPVKPIHQRIVNFLCWLLQSFTSPLKVGEVSTAPVQIKLKNSGREPDIFFVARENPGRMTEDYFDGAPDLIVEVVSDDSVNRDRVDKFEEYEEAGVREYWIVDPRPRRRRADFYQRDAHGKYQPVPVSADGVYRSVVLPGFWLNVNWLWEEPLPELFLTLNEIMGK